MLKIQDFNCEVTHMNNETFAIHWTFESSRKKYLARVYDRRRFNLIF